MAADSSEARAAFKNAPHFSKTGSFGFGPSFVIGPMSDASRPIVQVPTQHFVGVVEIISVGECPKSGQNLIPKK